MEAVFGSTRPPRRYRLTRRELLVDLGWGGVAVAVLAGCSSPSPSTPPQTSTPSLAPTTGPATAGGTATSGTATLGQLTWSRADLGFVSAYVLVRGRQAAVVDTGVAGSADAIGSALQSAGSTWEAVTDLVLTHHHGDHTGSLADVVARATKATVHAGAADISRRSPARVRSSPRPTAPRSSGCRWSRPPVTPSATSACSTGPPRSSSPATP